MASKGNATYIMDNQDRLTGEAVNGIAAPRAYDTSGEWSSR
jgi:hypothetical protein